MGKHFRKSQVPAQGWIPSRNRVSSAGEQTEEAAGRSGYDPAQSFADQLVTKEEPDRTRSFVEQLVSRAEPDTVQGQVATDHWSRASGDAAGHWTAGARPRGTKANSYDTQEYRLRDAERLNRALSEDLARVRDDNARLQGQVDSLTRKNEELSKALYTTRLERDALVTDIADLRSENARLGERLAALEERIAHADSAIRPQHDTGAPLQAVAPADNRQRLAHRLHEHFERAASRLFGSVESPIASTLSCERAEALKALRFDDDSHPNCYDNEDVNALYCVKYEMGYAFEHYFVYSHLLADLAERLRRPTEDPPVDIVSVGSGQDLDLWGLAYALTCLRLEGNHDLNVRWTGVDLEEWPNRIFDSWAGMRGVNHVRADIRSYLASLDGRMPAVLMFPKSISELPPDAIQAICNWISTARLTRPVHCIAIVHTDRSNMDASGYAYGNCSKDAVKAARIIDAFSAACSRSAHIALIDSCGHSDDHVASAEATYQVSKTERGLSHTVSYKYNRFDTHRGWFGDYYQEDPAFSPFAKRGRYVAIFDAANRLFECCRNWQAEGVYSPSGRFVDCNSTKCRNSQSCPLQRYPRVKLDAMAYQIVYGVATDAPTSPGTKPDQLVPF